MSHKATTWAIDQELPALQKIVLIMLADRHNKDTGRCDPALKTMAKDCGMSIDSVRRNLQKLADSGHLRIIHRIKPADEMSGKIQSSNFYILAFDTFTPRQSAEMLECQYDEIEAPPTSTQQVPHSLMATPPLAISYPNHVIESGKEEPKPLASSDKDRSQQPKQPELISEPKVFELPLVGGSEYGVPQCLYNEFVKAYPAVSVMAEFAKMRAWLISNATNKKTERGMPKFMNAWLSRAQNNAPVLAKSCPPPSPNRHRGRDADEVLRSMGIIK